MSIPGGGKRPSWSKALILVAIGGAVVFGVYLAYVAYSVDSFPVQERPFADYASVTSTSFNGTELAFQVKWLSSDYLPLYTQVTSATTDAANTPVCELKFNSVSGGQTIFMPFSISKPSQGLTDVDLWLAVRPLAGGGDFSIVYHLGTVSINSQGNLQPSNISCQQPVGGM